MALSQIIAHRVQRTNPTANTELQLRDNCWVQDGRIEECFRELKHCMLRRLGKDYGRFSEDHASHPMSQWLNEYYNDKLSFESFTQKAMKHLKSELDKTEVLLDGFVFFAHEVLEASSILHVFIAQHNTGQFIDGEMVLSESFYLDTSAMRLAAKINMTDWQSDDEHRSSNAVTLLRWRGEKEISDAFTHFIGFTEKRDLGAETEAFLNIVSDYTKDLPEDIAHHTKKQVVDFCLEQDKIGQPVIIEELSTQLKENPIPKHSSKKTANPSEAEEIPKENPSLPEFASFVSRSQPTAKPELIPDKSQLRQFVRLSGRNNQLSMSFSSSCLGDSIVYDTGTDSLIIKDIPPALKSRLTKHFQDSPANNNAHPEEKT